MPSMQMLWALLPYILLVANIVATVELFLGVSGRVARLRKAVSRNDAALQAESAQLTNAINELKHIVADMERTEGRASTDSESGFALNNAARGRVFKLHRSGQPSDHIAQKLHLPKGEVDLLIKVQRVVMRPYENSGTTTAPPRAEKG